ncbi:MAG: hypothetical protein JW910_12625 [Anaerolineae bacterium]|nr:hypothetical protein [Anaerolineae bacterium]
MNDNATISEHVLRYGTDEASINKAVAGVERIKGSFADLNKAAGDAARPLADVSKAAEMSDADRRVAELLDRIEDLKREAAELRRSLGDTFDGAADGARRTTDEVKDLARAQREAAERARLYGDVESRTRAITGAVGYVGGTAGEQIERTVNIGAEVLASVEAVKLLKLELPKLANNLDLSASKVALLTVGVVAAGTAAVVAHDAISDWSKAAKEAQQQTQAQIGALQEYYDFIGDATSEQLQERLRTTAEEQAANQMLLNDLYKLRGAIEAGVDISDRGAVEFFAEGAVRALDYFDLMNVGLGDISEAVSETETAVRQGQAAFSLYSKALTDGTTAANDAAARAEEGTRRRLEALDRQMAAELDNAQLIETATSEQVQSRLETLNVERAAIEAYKAELASLEDPSGQVGAKLAVLNDQLFILGETEARLTNNVLPAVEARERETAALEKQKAALEAAEEARLLALQDEQALALDRRDLLASFARESIAIEEDRAQSILEEQADFERQRLRDLAHHYQDIAKLDADAARKEADLLDKQADEQADITKEETTARQEHYRDLEKLSEEHQERLRQIQNDAQTDYEEAARRRDTSGALAAIRRGERDLKKEKDQYEKERRERAEALDERLAELNEERDEKRQAGIEALQDLREQHQRERAERIADFQQKLAEEDDDRRLSLERQRAAWDDEDQERRQHYADQLGLTEDKLQDIYDTTKSYLDDTADAWEDALNIMYGKTADLLTEAERSVTEIEQRRAQGYRGGHQNIEGFAGGGEPTPGDVVKVGEHGMEYARFLDPVHIYTRDQAKAVMGGSTTLNVNLGGLGGVQITAPPGLSARGLAEQAGGQLVNLVVDALEEIVAAYEAGG